MIEIIVKEHRSLYSHNVGVIKKYNDNTYKVMELKSLRNKGVQDNKDYSPKGSVNEDKLDCNIRRAKGKIQEYVLCNPWDYFVTLTLDKKKYDRYDLEKYHKDLTIFIRNLNKKREKKIKYLFIPEQHQDGAWHIHGFISGLNDSDLRKFKSTEKLPIYILDKLEKGQDVFQWVEYFKRFGFCDLEPIKNKARASSYVRKYITKELAKCVKDMGAHMYYCSRGLKKAEIIQKGTVSAKYTPTWNDEHVSVQWVENVTERQVLEYLEYNNNMSKAKIQEQIQTASKKLRLSLHGFREISSDQVIPFT